MSKVKLKDIILNDLKEQIVLGKYRIGDKLPPERELAENYKSSRIPVRQALQALSEAGVVRTDRGSGTVVVSTGNILETAPHVAHLLNGTDKSFLADTIKFRRLFEAEAARRASINRTAEDVKNIQQALFDSINEIRKLKANESNSFFEADSKFHLSICYATHDPFFVECFNSLNKIIAMHQFWSLSNTTPRDEVVSYHTRIYESILDENGEKAYSAMYEHLSRVEKLLTSSQEDQEEYETSI